jgi:hypothetical protein
VSPLILEWFYVRFDYVVTHNHLSSLGTVKKVHDRKAFSLWLLSRETFMDQSFEFTHRLHVFASRTDEGHQQSGSLRS